MPKQSSSRAACRGNRAVVMNRANSTRLFLISALATASAAELTWARKTEYLAGVRTTNTANGFESLPSFYALLMMSLVSMLALYVLPRWPKRFVLVLTLLSAVFVGWDVIGWIRSTGGAGWGSAIGLAAVVVAIIAAISAFPHSVVSKRAEKTGDQWTALDRGIDPTL